MTCADAQGLLSRSIDGDELAPDQEAAAAAHLDGCAACARAARELSSIHRLMVETRAEELLKPSKPDSRHRTKPRRRRPGTPPARPSWLTPLLIAAGLLIGAVGYFLMPAPAPVKPAPPPVPVAAATKTILGRIELVVGGASKTLDLVDGEGLKVPGAGSRAVVTWKDGTRMELGGDAVLDRVEEGERGKLVLFVRGALTADVTPQPAGRPLLFTTPHGEARVLGTTLTLKVDADPKKGTRLDVATGKVELRNAAGQTALVEAGFFAVAAAGTELVATKTVIPGWKNVTAGLGGPGGVTVVAAAPGRDEIIAGVAEGWLWSSVDGGETWKKLGDARGEPIVNKPHHLIFDPANPRRFWVCGIYGPGIFRTSDGGASFERLGALNHIDGLAVDFSDPARRTLLATHHLDPNGLEISTDGGATWERIGNRLPPETSSSSAPFILDSKTFLVDASGAFDKTEGIYRSTDAGKTWSRVSKVLPAGPPLLASDGSLYWQPRWGMGDAILKSADRGATWMPMKGPAKTTPVELDGGRLASAFEQQFYVSRDSAATWEKFGGPAPVKAAQTHLGMGYEAAVYSAARRAIYIWRNSTERSADSVFRWTLPE